MPTGPRAELIISEANLLFAGFKAGFNGPAHPAEPGEGGQGSLCRGIAQIAFEFTSGWIAAKNEPDIGARQTISDRYDPYGSKISDQRPFTAFLDGLGAHQGRVVHG